MILFASDWFVTEGSAILLVAHVTKYVSLTQLRKNFKLQAEGIKIFEAKARDICFMFASLCEQALGNILYGKRKKV